MNKALRKRLRTTKDFLDWKRRSNAIKREQSPLYRPCWSLLLEEDEQMQNVEISADVLSSAARKVFSQEELQTLTENQLLTFVGMVDRRMQELNAEVPTPELEGFKELVTVHLFPPGFTK
jgi:hypothetical protein